MRNLLGIFGGLAGGAIGAAAWAVIARWSGYEVGWVAWGVGALVGAGFAVAARGAGRFAGAAAAVIALGSVVAGKAMAFQLTLDRQAASGLEALRELQHHGADEELLVSLVADEIVIERTEAGRDVHWPGGARPETPDRRRDYPMDVWSEAAARWSAMSAADREDFRAAWVGEVERSFAGEPSIFADPKLFLLSFGPMDLVFILLAIATAAKFASSASAAGNERDGDPA